MVMCEGATAVSVCRVLSVGCSMAVSLTLPLFADGILMQTSQVNTKSLGPWGESISISYYQQLGKGLSPLITGFDISSGGLRGLPLSFHGCA